MVLKSFSESFEWFKEKEVQEENVNGTRVLEYLDVVKKLGRKRV